MQPFNLSTLKCRYPYALMVGDKEGLEGVLELSTKKEAVEEAKAQIGNWDEIAVVDQRTALVVWYFKTEEVKPARKSKKNDQSWQLTRALCS